MAEVQYHWVLWRHKSTGESLKVCKQLQFTYAVIVSDQKHFDIDIQVDHFSRKERKEAWQNIDRCH